MVTVRYFGPTRLLSKRSGVRVEAGSIKELLERLAVLDEGVTLPALRNSLIFINGDSIQNLKGFRTKLVDGDEVQIFSPMGGG